MQHLLAKHSRQPHNHRLRHLPSQQHTSQRHHKQTQPNQKEQTTMLTACTCATCPDNKCDVRENCPDDATTTQKRKEVCYELPSFSNYDEPQTVQPTHLPQPPRRRLPKHRKRSSHKNHPEKNQKMVKGKVKKCLKNRK